MLRRLYCRFAQEQDANIAQRYWGRTRSIANSRAARAGRQRISSADRPACQPRRLPDNAVFGICRRSKHVPYRIQIAPIIGHPKPDCYAKQACATTTIGFLVSGFGTPPAGPPRGAAPLSAVAYRLRPLPRAQAIPEALHTVDDMRDIRRRRAIAAAADGVAYPRELHRRTHDMFMR